MKNLIITLFLVVGFCTLSSKVLGQDAGHWIKIYDPNTRQTTMRYVRDSPATKAPQKYSPENAASAKTVPMNETPVYQNQQQTIVRKGCDFGINPYRLRPYGGCSVSSETVKVTAATNDTTYNPNIVVNSRYGNYSWPHRY